MAFFSFLPDPLQTVRQLVNTLEARINTLAGSGLQSEKVARTLNEMVTLSLALQHLFGSVTGSVLRRLNLPSRQEVNALATALHRIEARLEQLLASQTQATSTATSISPAPHRPRPARTRRPPSPPVAAPQAVTPAPAPVSVAATTRPARTVPAAKARATPLAKRPAAKRQRTRSAQKV